MIEPDMTSDKLWAEIDKLHLDELTAVLTHPSATEMHIVKILGINTRTLPTSVTIP